MLLFCTFSQRYDYSASERMHEYKATILLRGVPSSLTIASENQAPRDRKEISLARGTPLQDAKDDIIVLIPVPKGFQERIFPNTSLSRMSLVAWASDSILPNVRESRPQPDNDLVVACSVRVRPRSDDSLLPTLFRRCSIPSVLSSKALDSCSRAWASSAHHVWDTFPTSPGPAS